ncbi:type VI secretion system protein TssA [Yersinia pseudotuberculosis]|nr:type VI secretion system protein TssA [Yersinia pseudotuberculosis]AYX13574.1 type VI secretion system protein TssA [Yersinia pseudotuberculosis]MBO1567444.1 type VI secretion system protein TssA [Yersinia pseudotuberculosis]MBO1590766.1 type VI secretion system protein TssA [Yersinia pseudotuberculosis]MBO1604303.1 type VI secretion system protein TssA [Yersinia pseudotuberculosis]
MRHMDITSQHPWHVLLQAPLSPEQTAQALADDDPQWEYIDGQMVKLGSLAHATLNIDDIQQQAMALLSQKSKDFRLVVHLLRTLQHGGQPDELMLAMSLLTEYVQLFWTTAWPQNPLHKRRFAQQILKRFDSASSSFSQRADEAQRENVQGLLAHLAQVWHSREPGLAKEVDALRSRYARPPERVIEAVASDEPLSSNTLAAAMAATPVSPSLAIDNTSDRAWRQTLLKMADLLSEQQPDAAIGFRLRRHAVWGALTAPPMAQSDGRTPLAAVSADRTADYLARLANTDLPLWHQVEQSLTLAPYWLDGHVLSAQIALQLGYDAVAQAIRDELSVFLARIPALKTLFFTDMTPFLSSESAAWLQQDANHQGRSRTIEQDEIWQCYQQQGLEAALQMINRQPQQSEPRDRFYHQLLSAQLFEKAGLTALAQQHYHSLLLVGQQLQLSEWEPALIALLTEKQRQLKP